MRAVGPCAERDGMTLRSLGLGSGSGRGYDLEVVLYQSATWWLEQDAHKLATHLIRLRVRGRGSVPGLGLGGSSRMLTR